ncbi:MAG: TraU family protein [Candidatus Lariskella arthropodorum]
MCIKNCVVHGTLLKVKISFLHYSKLISIFVALIYITGAQRAQGGACQGRFLNPITDICWSCIFPITVGSVPIAGTAKLYKV